MLLAIGACKKDWEAHNAITDPMVATNLMQRIEANSQLSTFTGLLKRSGYDTVLAGSKNYTVFAPTNDALAALPADVVNDSSKLNPILRNHIAGLQYRVSGGADTLRILTLGGKYHNITGNTISGVTIRVSNDFTSNGILHVIAAPLMVMPNIWEALNLSSFPRKQSAFLQSLNYMGFDPAKAEQIGVNPQTGEPIFRPGTGEVMRNVFWDKVFDLTEEAPQYTFFALEDAGFDAETAANSSFYAMADPSLTDSVTRLGVLKDLVFEGLIPQSILPDTLTNKFGARVGINKASIVRTIHCSNGIVYVMSSLPVLPTTRFVSRIIEAEHYIATSHNRRSNTFFRDRINPLTNQMYRDVLVSGHGVALFNMQYQLSDMPAMKYRAYWVAVNDFQAANFTQKLGIIIPTSTVLPYITVAPNVFQEVFLGEFTLTQFTAALDVFLTAANSTAAAANPLVCDYIRIEPAL